MGAFENYTQVALCNAQMSNILSQMLTVAPSLAEKCAMKSMLCSTVAGMWRWNSAKVQSRIILAALMSDIGLKDTPLLVDKKRIDFTAKELAIFEQHPFSGFQILNQIPDMPEEILLVTLQHHENSAGLGFPQKLPRSKVHAYSKLVHGVGEFLDTLYVQKDPSMVQETLEQLHAVQSKIISEQVLKSLFILFKVKLPKPLNDVLLPSETNRVS